MTQPPKTQPPTAQPSTARFLAAQPSAAQPNTAQSSATQFADALAPEPDRKPRPFRAAALLHPAAVLATVAVVVAADPKLPHYVGD